ncbi:MAG: glycosyltransferase [Cyclobacteriaceae bacterium]|nr:glycosyltransferase [Cyclobacteriaceae bacterium]
MARNFGILQAAGDYITFLDSDDELYPHYLDEALTLIKQYNRPEWFHIAYEIRDEAGRVLRKEHRRKGNINQSLITGNHLSCIGVFVKKDILEQHQFNEDPDIIGSEDYLLWLKLASLFPLRYSNRISAYVVQHRGRSVINFNQHQLIRRIKKSIEIVNADADIRNFSAGQCPNSKPTATSTWPIICPGPHSSFSLKYYPISIRIFLPIVFHRNSYSYLNSLIMLKS